MRAKAAVAIALLACTLAVIQASRTIPAGAKIRCVLAQGVNSATLTVGQNFELKIDDPSQPGLEDAKIVGHITDVAGPGGFDRARIGFTFDYIRFNDLKKAPIHAIVLSKRVTQTNSAEAAQEVKKFQLPPMPNGTVTPGPIAFQINFRQDSRPSVTPPPVGSTVGFIYAEESNESIVIPPGQPVTIKLTRDLLVQ